MKKEVVRLQLLPIILLTLTFLTANLTMQAIASAPSNSIVVANTSFGDDGFVYPNLQTFHPTSTTVIQTTDNKLIAIDSHIDGSRSYFGLTRYDDNGMLDNSFGNAGLAIGGVAEDYALAAVQQPDGKLIVVGTSFNILGIFYKMQMMRFLADGSVDTDFGTDGVVQTNVGSCTEATAVTLQPDNKILLAGCISNDEFALLRFLPDGTPDSGFGTNGVATATVGTSATVVDLLLQDDGSIVLAGHERLLFRTILVGFTSGGVLDNNFGSAGIVNIQATTQDLIETAVLQNDGKIILAGTGYPDSINPADILLLRFNQDGTLDNSFGINGVTVTDLNGPMGESAEAIALQLDGKLVVAGWTARNSDQNEPLHELVLLQYLSDGTLDSSFGSSGWALFNTNDQSTIAHDLLLSPSGQMVVAGAQDTQTFMAQFISISVTSQAFLPFIVR